MSSGISLHVSHVMRGPTLRINFITTTSTTKGMDEATSSTFMIDNLVQVMFKFNHHSYSDHSIYMLAFKAKDDVISMYVTCDAMKYSKKWTCSDINRDWKHIGIMKGQALATSKNCVYLSQTEIIITVYNMSKPGFPMLYDCDLTDFILSTTDGDVAVHKACLAKRSPVFKTMITGTWKEAKENKVEIKDYSLQTVQLLKDYLYLGTLPDNGLCPLLSFAALYSINDLKKDCIRKLALTVQPEDLYSLHEFACANNIPELSYAIGLLTPECVVDQCYKEQKKEDGQNKLNDEKQTDASKSHSMEDLSQR